MDSQKAEIAKAAAAEANLKIKLAEVEKAKAEAEKAKSESMLEEAKIKRDAETKQYWLTLGVATVGALGTAALIVGTGGMAAPVVVSIVQGAAATGTTISAGTAAAAAIGTGAATGAGLVKGATLIREAI